MKKIIPILLAASMLLSLASCGEQTDTTNSTTTSQTEAPIHQEQPADQVFYRRGHLFAESDTRILYFPDSRTLYQYNKFTEETDAFCFDPLCEHGKSCISSKFNHLGSMVGNGNQSMQYCEYDKRYYFTRGEQIYSISFDGSDAKIACSFGETGKIENDDKIEGNKVGGASAVSFMSIYDRYIYFFTVDSENGIRTLKRYDISTGDIIDVVKRSRSESTVTFYGFIDGYLYAGLIGEVYGVYRMNLDGTDMVKLHDDIIDQNYVWGLFDGEYAYAIQTTSDGLLSLNSYSILSGETTNILSSDTNFSLLAVTGDKLYCAMGETITQENEDGSKSRITYTRIVCIDKNTKEVKIVLDDSAWDTIKDIHFLGDAVFLNGSTSINGKKTFGIFTAKIDENGMFTEITVLK